MAIRIFWHECSKVLNMNNNFMNKLLLRNTTQIPVIGRLLSKTGKPWYRFLRRTFLREVSKSDISEEDLSEEDISEKGISEEDIPEEDISEFLVDISNLTAINKLYLHTNLCSLGTKKYDNFLSDMWFYIKFASIDLFFFFISGTFTFRCSKFLDNPVVTSYRLFFQSLTIPLKRAKI